MKSNKLTILLADMKYAIFSVRFVISIILGILVCFFTLMFCGKYQSETIHKYVLLHDRSQSFLAYIVGILPYCRCFYEDLIHGNIRNIIGRIKLRDYIFSKTIAAYVSTILAFLLGKLLFVWLHSLYNPICLDNTFDKLPGSLLYLDFAREGQYFLFFLLSGLQKAFYCAILCQIVMLFSICIQNISAVFSVPIAFFYVVHFYLNNKIRVDCLNFSRVFDGATRIWKADSANFLYSLLIMVICGRLLYQVTIFGFQRKIYHE